MTVYGLLLGLQALRSVAVGFLAKGNLSRDGKSIRIFIPTQLGHHSDRTCLYHIHLSNV